MPRALSCRPPFLPDRRPKALTTAIVKTESQFHYDPRRPNIVLRKALSDQNAIYWGPMYSCQISQDCQTAHNVDSPRDSHDSQANAASISGWSAELITLQFDQVEDQCNLRNEPLHGRDDAGHSLFCRTLLYAKVGTLLALDCPILSRITTTHHYPRPFHYRSRGLDLSG
jgi:hypothetical protein